VIREEKETRALPDGWVIATLGDLAIFQNGRVFKAQEWGSYGRPIIRIQNLTGSAEKINRFDGEVEDRYIVRDGDFLISWSATLGSFIYRGEEAVLNQHIFKVTPFIEKQFLYYGTLYYLDEIKKKVRGSGMQHIIKSDFDNIKFSLPPLNEQKRIVEKLEALMSDLDTAVQSLKNALGKLETYRRSVLKAAVEGELTHEWREVNQATLQPADELLTRILQEHRERWTEEQESKNRKNAVYEAPIAPDLSSQPDLPKGWVWATLDQLSWSSGYGTSERSAYEFSGIPILRIPNIQNGSIDLSDLKFAAESLRIDERSSLKIGDVLIIRTNGSRDLIGRAAVVINEFETFHYFASYLIRFRLVQNFMLHRWVNAIWSSEPLRQLIEGRATTTAGQYNINMTSLESLPIPLPPENEQEQILEIAELHFAAASDLELNIKTQLAQAEQTRQSMLEKAFSGRLVPQDPSDEPASALLERIRAEKIRTRQEAKVKKPKSTTLKTQQSNESTSLVDTLRASGRPLTPEELFRAAGYTHASLEQFFKDLKTAQKNKEVVQTPSDAGIRDRLLSAPI
jgi:type I restriction enzyme, S subunit